MAAAGALGPCCARRLLVLVRTGGDDTAAARHPPSRRRRTRRRRPRPPGLSDADAAPPRRPPRRRPSRWTRRLPRARRQGRREGAEGPRPKVGKERGGQPRRPRRRTPSRRRPDRHARGGRHGDGQLLGQAPEDRDPHRDADRDPHHARPSGDADGSPSLTDAPTTHRAATRPPDDQPPRGQREGDDEQRADRDRRPLRARRAARPRRHGRGPQGHATPGWAAPSRSSGCAPTWPATPPSRRGSAARRSSSASLNHPSIVSVYDTGEEMATDGTDVAQPYIVMECVQGRTLRDILREGRKILPERALEITSGVLSALDYSHRAGIIHRDIKPGNVMLTPERRRQGDGLRHRPGRLRRLLDDDPDRRGRRHRAVPLPRAGPRRDRRLPLGRLLHRLPALRAPHRPAAVRRATARSRSPTSTCASSRRRRPTSTTELDPEIDAIVMKSLAKRVEDRYQSAAAMKRRHRALPRRPPDPGGRRRRRGHRGRPAGRRRHLDAARRAAAGPRDEPPARPHRADGPPRPAGHRGLIAGRRTCCPACSRRRPAVQVPALVGLTEERGADRDRPGRPHRRPGQPGAVGGRRPRQGHPPGPQPRRLRRPRHRRGPRRLARQARGAGALRRGPAPRGGPGRAARPGAQGAATEVESDEPKGQVSPPTRPPASPSRRAPRSRCRSPTGPSRSPTCAGSRRARPRAPCARRASRSRVRTDAASTEPKGTVVDQFPQRRGRGRPRRHGDHLRVRLRRAAADAGDPDRDAHPDADGADPTQTPTETPPTTLPTTPTQRRAPGVSRRPAGRGHRRRVGEVEQAVVGRGGGRGSSRAMSHDDRRRPGRRCSRGRSRGRGRGRARPASWPGRRCPRSRRAGSRGCRGA